MKSMTAMIDRDSEQFDIALQVDVQRATDAVLHESESVPSDEQLRLWANAAYEVVQGSCALPVENEITLRLVGNDEIVQLNRDYRGKDKATNVLSFPAETPEHLRSELPPYLGDIVIAHDVVTSEAQSEGKEAHQHYAHMVTHGVLHLCGYDHQCDDSAEKMESLEAEILSINGFPYPYPQT